MKLRTRYEECAARYNRKWFDSGPFEERFQMALRNRMNLEGFILAEITAFEKLKDLYDRKSTEKSFSETVNNIIEENTARIRKYPRVDFHPRSGCEIGHFYGAMSEFVMYYFPVLWLLNPDEDIRKIMFRFENDLHFLAMPQGKKPSRRIEDHALLLARPNVRELEIERDTSEYLKDSALLLHEIIDFCEGLLQTRRSEWESPLSFTKLFVEDSRRKRIVDLFSGSTGYGALVSVSGRARDIIADFRLKAFRK
jgi:hypothetical protein